MLDSHLTRLAQGAGSASSHGVRATMARLAGSSSDTRPQYKVTELEIHQPLARFVESGGLVAFTV